MLNPRSACRLELGNYSPGCERPSPVAIIDGAQSQAFVLLDGGITGQDGRSTFAYQQPDQWTWGLFKQLVARLRKNCLNDLSGIIFDSLRKLSRSSRCSGYATLIVGSTIPQVMGTDKFIILDVTTLSDGSAVLLRPHGPKVDVEIANLPESDISSRKLHEHESNLEDGIVIQIEKLKAVILLHQIRRNFYALQLESLLRQALPEEQEITEMKLRKFRKKLQSLQLKIDLGKEKLEELQFQKFLVSVINKEMRWKEIMQRSIILDRKITVCWAKLILHSIIMNVTSNETSEYKSLLKKLELLQSFLTSWSNSPDALEYRQKRETAFVIFNALDVLLKNVFNSISPEMQAEAVSSVSPELIKREAKESGERTEDSDLIQTVVDIVNNIKETVIFQITTSLTPSVSIDQERNLDDAGAKQEDILLQSLWSTLEESYGEVAGESSTVEETPGEGEAGSAPKSSHERKERSKKGARRTAALGGLHADDPREGLRYKGKSKLVQFPDNAKLSQGRHYSYNHRSLFSELSDDMRRLMNEKEQKAKMKVVRFNGHIELVGESGWSLGLSNLNIDESRRRVLKPTEKYIRKIPLRFEIVSKTRRLVSALTRRTKWYPNIRELHNEMEDWIMGSSRQPGRHPTKRAAFPWQLMSVRRESCPPELYDHYKWILFPGDIIITGNHSLWNAITDRELTELVDRDYSYDCMHLAKSVADLAIRRRNELPILLHDTGPIACVVCKVNVQPQRLERIPEKKTKSCVLL